MLFLQFYGEIHVYNEIEADILLYIDNIVFRLIDDEDTPENRNFYKLKYDPVEIYDQFSFEKFIFSYIDRESYYDRVKVLIERCMNRLGIPQTELKI